MITLLSLFQATANRLGDDPVQLALTGGRQQTHIVVFALNGWFAWIVVGLLAGWIAGHITRGRGFGCLVDIFLGLIGAVLGGWIFSRLGISALGFFGSLAAATVGAILLVAIARLFAGHD